MASDTRLRRREGVVLRHVAGEQILVPTVAREVDLDSLFLLNATGAFIWEQLDGQRPVRDLGAAVAKAFGADPDAATADVMGFLSSLLERNLAEFASSHGL
jgi:hypothetical protein